MQRHLRPVLVGISRRGVRVVRALRLRGGSLRANDESRCARTWGRMEVEAVGLDGERLLQFEGVGRIFHRKVESLEDGGEGDDGLLPCKRTTLVSCDRQGEYDPTGWV